jgi:hypothetical protein
MQTASAFTVGWEPLQCDLLPALQGHYYVVRQISALGVLVTNLLPPGAVVSGLYVVRASDPLESLADATAGFSMDARGPHRLNTEYYSEAIGARFAFSLTAQLYQPLIIPTGYTIRAIVTPNPGTATPGPGAGSSLTLSAALSDEEV